MLSNADFLAKFRFDTAENEPAKNLQNFKLLTLSCTAEAAGAATAKAAARAGAAAARSSNLHSWNVG